MAKAIWSCVIVVVPLLLITNLTGTHPNPMQPVFCEPDSGYTGDDPRIRQVLDFAGAVSFHHTVIPNVAVVLTFSPRIGFTSEHVIDPGPIRFVIEAVVDTHDVIPGRLFCIQFAFAGEVVMQLAIGA